MHRLMRAEEKMPGLEEATIGDFWSWAYSDLMGNTIRPVFAEYLVGRCLGVLTRPRVDWNYVDFIYAGKKVEVKSSAYVQTWAQRTPSVISFDIGVKEKPWIAETNSYGAAGRSADCYVFCVHTEIERSKCEVADPAQWRFYVMSAAMITNSFGSQQSVRLSRLQAQCSPTSYDNLRAVIDDVLGLTASAMSAAATIG